MHRILREPLLHFLVLGAGLFVAYGLLSKSTGAAPGKIVVTSGQIEHLVAGFAKTWQRAPTDSEVKGLIDEWVRDEIATREAMALGLDKDDTVIRRRLRQKLEFLSDDITAQVEPTDADLAGYLAAHPASFLIEPRLTFTQVYFDPAKHGERLASDVAHVLAQLKSAGTRRDPAALGDSIMLESSFQSTPPSEIAKQFGDAFAKTLAGLPVGQWQGPIESAYGAHLVLIAERTEGSLPALADVRDAVRREWDNSRRLEGNKNFYQELLKRYDVTIEPAAAANGPSKVAQTQ